MSSTINNTEYEHDAPSFLRVIEQLLSEDKWFEAEDFIYKVFKSIRTNKIKEIEKIPEKTTRGMLDSSDDWINGYSEGRADFKKEVLKTLQE